MIYEKCAQLIALFEGLVQRTERVKEALELGEIIQHCFSVVALISEQDAQIYSIAKSLRVIPRTKQRLKGEDKLREDLIEVEQSLNENLRGFSCLLDTVLEDTALKINTTELVDALPTNYRPLALIFCDLHLQFEAYNGLYLAFGADSREAETLLFLRAVRQVMVLLRQSNDELVHHEIIDFLRCFVKNNTLRALYELDLNYHQPREVALYCEASPDRARALLTVLLSIISAERIAIDSETSAILDRALRSADLLGLEPFVESGFIGKSF